MNEISFKHQVINHLAEQKVPEDYDPWKKMQTRFGVDLAGQELPGHVNDAHRFSSKQLVRSAVLAALVLVLAVGALFFTSPSGRVVAQSIIDLFTKTDGDERSVPDAYSSSGVTTSGLSIKEAEKLASYKVVVPTSLPDGYSLTDVIYNSQSQGVSQIYKFSPYQSGEMFIFTQQIAFPSDPPIGQSAEVEQLQLGNTTVESVIGSWFAPGDSNTEHWVPEAPVHTFRWQKDGFYFTLEFWVNDTFSPAYLSEKNRQEILEIFLGTRVNLSENFNLNNIKSLEEAEMASGMQILAPATLPEGWVFSHAVYEPENRRVILIYLPENSSKGPNTNSASLVIIETPITPSQKPASYDGYPPEALEEITIGQFNGTFIQGAVVDGIYNPNFGFSIQGQTDLLNITINYYKTNSDSVQLDKEQMIAIAESLQ